MARTDERRRHPLSRSVDALIRAGREADLRDLGEKYAQSAAGKFAAIRNDKSRSPEWIRAELAKASQTLKANITAELEALARAADVDDQRDATMVFGTGGLPGDAASLAISARDASDRVDQARSETELHDLLDRATRTGDEVLARAVVRRAVDDGLPAIVNAFTATRPALDAATERLWARTQRETRSSFFFPMYMAALNPSMA